MRNQVDNWLAGDWAVLGAYVHHWAVVLVAIVLVALLVAWFERPKRAPARPSSRSHITDRGMVSEHPYDFEGTAEEISSMRN